MSEADHPAETLLAALPGFNGLLFNPLALIKAANTFHKLGFEASLQRLGEAAAAADPENVLLVARVLYLPAAEGEHLPRLDLGLPDVTEPEDPGLFPVFPLHLQQDLPLLLIGGYLAGGESLPPSVYLDWCARHGRLRPRPLHPQDNPLTGVDELIESAAWQALQPAAWQFGMLRGQALRAVANLIPLISDQEQALLETSQGTPFWLEQRQREQASGIAWDAAGGAFRFAG